MSFDGFTSGAPVTPLPQALLRDLVPAMSDPAELIVTLYAVEAISRVRRYPRRLLSSNLRESRTLLEALAGMCAPRGADQAFVDGLDAAVARGSLLRSRSVVDEVWVEWIAINDADGSRAMASPTMLQVTTPIGGRKALDSGVLEIWQSAFGTSPPPILVEELKAAEARFGVEWLRAAFTEAAASNVRNWRYVRKVLDRWESEHGHG